MVKNPPDNMPQISPYLCYDDLPAALDFLEKTFGFKRRFEMPDSNGKVVHAELALGAGVVMAGPGCDESGCKSPLKLGGVNQSLYVYVDDVDKHHAHAKALGAPGIAELQDMFWGDRMYEVKDCEGHNWVFAQHVRDVAPEDMQMPG